jgi:hypothetical protein
MSEFIGSQASAFHPADVLLPALALAASFFPV